MYCSWFNRCHNLHVLLSACREEAELEYLKVGQELEMYGVNYFEIKVRTLVQYVYSVCLFSVARQW